MPPLQDTASTNVETLIEIFSFAEKWRVYDGKNASKRIKISEEETIPGRVINYDYISSRGDPEPT